MNTNALILAFGTVLLVSTAISLIYGISRGTIQSFFWGDQNVSRGLSASMMLTSSFSLNGLLYQAWLGFSIGWWSLLVQAVWCAGFVVLAFNAPRFRELLNRGTMHGIIASRFGTFAGKIAAVASVLGFSILIGWESVVGATVLKNATGAGDLVYIVLPLVLVFVASFYTSTGGLRGNAAVNAVQNIFKVAVLTLGAILILSDNPLGLSALYSAPAAGTSLTTAIVNLGGVALLANLAFSFFLASG